MSDEKKERGSNWGKGKALSGGRVLVGVLLHVSGILFVSAIAALLVVGPIGLQTIWSWQWATSTTFLGDWGLHIGLSALVWGLGYFSIRRLLSYKDVKRVKLAGTVLTESLIVLPAFFALFTVMVQISLNNVMGMLASVAAHQAARTVWVWNGESGIGPAELKKKAQIQAAMVMLPVGQSGFQSATKMKKDANNNYLNEALAIVVAPHLPFGGSARAVDGMVSASIAANDLSSSSETSFYRSFDTASFAARAPIKFIQAYSALSKSEVASSGNMVGYKLRFEYVSTLPFYGLFANQGDGDLVIEREFYLPKQTPPNRTLPK